MAEEQKTQEAITPTPEQAKIAELEGLLENISFFSDQVKVNATLFKGMTLILKKITEIEARLNNGTQ